jgi:predicted ATPase
MVGEGTRSIIASLIQIEVHRFFKRGPSFLTLREFENHLHPSLVGRFFRYLVKRTSNTNINLIIETHSEIVLRTLQSIVKNSNENISDDILDAKNVGIYYINKKRPGDTVIEKLILDRSGYFDTEKGSDLPPDFFDINSKLSRELQE